MRYRVCSGGTGKSRESLPVEFARGLYARLRHLIHEIAKFGVVGGIGFIITLVGFNLCHFDLKLGLFTSNAIATVAAAIITFVGNKYWTFRHRSGQGTRRETVAFIVLNAIGMLIQYACTWIAEDGFGVKDKFLINVAYLIGIGLGTLFRFWSYRKWVWHAPAAPPPLEETSPQGDLVYPR
jgi:putative flippase GtrA